VKSPAGAAGADYAALAEARHVDPFAVLGPHIVDGEVVIRAMLPGAERVAVIRRDGDPIDMQCKHASGVYEARWPGTSVPDYRLRITYPGGGQHEIDDPYRYGRVIGDYDLYLFGEGNHTRIYEKLGAHPIRIGDTAGVHFSVWAPNAARVSTVGDFNHWDGRVHPMRSLGSSGVWEIFVPGAAAGQRYKFEILTRYGEILLKTDPYGLPARSRRSPLRSSPRSTTSGTTATGCRRARRTTRGCTGRWRSTRSTSARGCGCRRGAIAT
jgi:1,4-alpha-glucan branching enzyme